MENKLEIENFNLQEIIDDYEKAHIEHLDRQEKSKSEIKALREQVKSFKRLIYHTYHFIGSYCDHDVEDVKQAMEKLGPFVVKDLQELITPFE